MEKTLPDTDAKSSTEVKTLPVPSLTVSEINDGRYLFEGEAIILTLQSNSAPIGSSSTELPVNKSSGIANVA